MTGHQKDNIFVLILLQGGPQAARRPLGPIFGPIICIFLRYTYETAIFWLGRTRLKD